MKNNNLEIVDRSTVSNLLKEMIFIDESILEKTSQLLPELKLTLGLLSPVIPKLHQAINHISVVKNKDDKLQEQIQNLTKVIDSLFPTLNVVDNQNRIISIGNKSLIERLEEIDFEVMENVIRKDLKVLERELKTSILKEFQKQKTKLMHTYALYFGIFIIGSITGAALIHFLKG